jgi:hypothetical protein
MTEANGMSQSSDTSSSQTVTSSSTPQAAPQAPAPVSEERSFKQSEVNDIVKRAKHGAVEDFKRMSQERPDYVQQKHGETATPQNNQQYAGNNNAPNEEAYRRIAAEEAQRLRDTWVKEAQSKSEAEYAQRTVQQFFNKVSTGREKYQDFDQITGDVALARFPNVVQLLADHVDNAQDVFYELGKDRTKLAVLEQLADMSPTDAVVQVGRISQAMKDNEAASKARIPNQPLDQLRPSNTGTDNGVMSVKDYRAKYRV